MPNTVEQQARAMAADHLKNDKDIAEVYWFPSTKEVRLIEVQNNVPKNDECAIQPFYFPASVNSGRKWSSAIDIIRPEEFGKLKLPKAWGHWKKAVKLGGKA